MNIGELSGIKVMVCRRSKCHFSHSRGRVDFCAAAVSQPGKGTREITLPVRGLCQHRAGSEFSDTVQFPVISTGGMALD